jgi:hypothetical protein
MIKGRRLSDLSLRERDTFYEFVKLNKERKNILELINKKFGMEYSRSSMMYLLRLGNRTEEKERLIRDNLIMERWNKELKAISSVNYAEKLSELLSNKLTAQEFNDITKGISFDNSLLSKQEEI